MAASSSLCNFLSFLTPSKRPPSQAKPPPPHLHRSLPNPEAQRGRDAFVPLVAQPGPSFSSSSSELESVMNASLAYANTIFFKSAYNVQVIVDEGKSEERLLNLFRREVMRAGVIQEVKREEVYFQNTRVEKKLQWKSSIKGSC